MPATDGTPEVTVVVPVYRNATTIAELAARIDRALAARSYEILFVDDASPDASRFEIRRLAAADARISGVALEENVGQNAAVVAGIAHANGTVVAVMDADLQDPPEALPTLIAALDDRAVDAVFAGRTGRYASFSRHISGRLLKWSLWALTRGKVPVEAGLFVVMRRSVVDRLVASAGSDPYVVVLVARAAGSIATVPVRRHLSTRSGYTASMRASVALRALASALRTPHGRRSYRIAEYIGPAFSADARR